MAIYSYDEGLAVSTPIKFGSSASNTGILVDANGKVGIQKSVPTEDLDVAGTVAISSTLDVSGDIALAADTIEFKLGASGDAQQWWSGTDFHINVNSGEIRLGGGKTTVVASTTARASLTMAHGTAPTSPVNGDMWTTTAGLYVRINGSTVGPLS
jgi:hypothetical protein